MKDYTVPNNCYSMFLKEKSDERLKQRLDIIRSRKNCFLPDINQFTSKSPNKKYGTLKTDTSLSSTHKQTLKDLGTIDNIL
jgi:hypothetical protein